ncbi:type IV pilin [Natrononativus amylolyticus]|uniref:type IV pilin n=1 Tax=Natrononativus amylolyticus TaxID=2963434 RepID=UPI0020CDAF54|nr:type IV pilin N-terminal domain-containing protein [Natrononativus amylolyticus]
MNFAKKLIGNDEERAVSPVIGVILMVAITVILAAVIAAFVLDMGQSQSSTASAGVSVDHSTEQTLVQLTDSGNSEKVNVRASIVDDSGLSNTDTEAKIVEDELDSVGDRSKIYVEDGGSDEDEGSLVEVRITAVAESGDDENVVLSNDFEMVVVDSEP